MKAISIIAFILLAMVLIKEASYFTPKMIYTRKTAGEKIIFLCGIAILAVIMLKFAEGFFEISFGCMGIAAFFLMWQKQGVSEKGVLTIAHFGKEFYPWSAVGSVKAKEGKTVRVSWLEKDGSVILEQKYSKENFERLRERLDEKELRLRQYSDN